MKKTDGFTLIELLVGILCAALITGAAMSMLLMGVRVNKSLGDANTDQQNTRIIMSLIEGLASEGNIEKVETLGTLTEGEEDTGNRDWTLLDSDASGGEVVLYYSASGNAIRTKDGATLMSGVTASTASFKNGLLKFSITTDEGTYESAVYCRTATANEKYFELDKNNTQVDTSGDGQTSNFKPNTSDGARMKLLEILCAEYGTSSGGKYNRWYPKSDYNNGWTDETPWCATFLSWAVAEGRDSNGNTLSSYLSTVPCEANVDNLWNSLANKHKNTPTNRYAASPGDFIFFSWDNDPSTLEHVGAVFAVDGTWVYTIEGNSGGKVALHRYLLEDNSIVGYGVLDWKTTS